MLRIVFRIVFLAFQSNTGLNTENGCTPFSVDWSPSN
jgi:hypothetical protein